MSFTFTMTSFRRHDFVLPSRYFPPNLSSPAAEIVTVISERTPIIHQGKKIGAFGPAIGVVATVITINLVFWTSSGKEQRRNRFDAAQVAGSSYEPENGMKDVEDGNSNEEGLVEAVENVTPRLGEMA